MAAVAPSWQLRPATRDDREFLFRLHRDTLREYVDATWGWNDDEQRLRFDERFEERLPQFRIVCIGDDDVGVLRTEDHEDVLYLALLEIAPRWQGHGVGTAIVRWLLDAARGSGRAVTLHVLRTNPRAARLYASLGFAVEAEDAEHLFMRARP